MQATHVLETCLYVDDLVAAEDFYTRVCGLKRISRVVGRHVFFRCGDGVFLLFNPEATSQPSDSVSSVPTHGARGPGHVAFAMRHADIDAWREHLRRKDVEIEQEMAWPGEGGLPYMPTWPCQLATNRAAYEFSSARYYDLGKPPIVSVDDVREWLT